MTKGCGGAKTANFVVTSFGNVTLVYKYTNEFIGFIDTECFDSQAWTDVLDAGLENSTPMLATHVLQIVVQGIACELSWPFAHFATKDTTADDLYKIVWGAVARLEAVGIRILCLICDYCTVNRKLFSLLTNGTPYKHKTVNIFALDEERDLHLICDPCHLYKTARKSVYNSNFGRKTRLLWNNGSEITWTHFIELYEKDST